MSDVRKRVAELAPGDRLVTCWPVSGRRVYELDTVRPVVVGGTGQEVVLKAGDRVWVHHVDVQVWVEVDAVKAIEVATHVTGRNDGERQMVIAGLNAIYGSHLGMEPGEPLSAAELKRLALDWTSQAGATRKRGWNARIATLRAELEGSDNADHIRFAVCQWGLIALCWELA